VKTKKQTTLLVIPQVRDGAGNWKLVRAAGN